MLARISLSCLKKHLQQFKEAFESISDYDKMSDSDKKYLYDQMVILGMTLAVTQSQNQQNPNSKTTADLRKAGKDILEGMFGIYYTYIFIICQCFI